MGFSMGISISPRYFATALGSHGKTVVQTNVQTSKFVRASIAALGRQLLDSTRDNVRQPQNIKPKSNGATRTLLAEIERRLNSLGLTIPERLFDESDSAFIMRMTPMFPGIMDDIVERLYRLEEPPS